VHLKVANLQRSLDFYVGVLGFELTQKFGDQAAFISAGGYHHHIGLNTWKARAVARRRPGPPGFTIRRSFIRPGRLGDALRRLNESRHPAAGGAITAFPKRCI